MDVGSLRTVALCEALSAFPQSSPKSTTAFPPSEYPFGLAWAESFLFLFFHGIPLLSLLRVRPFHPQSEALGVLKPDTPDEVARTS